MDVFKSNYLVLTTEFFLVSILFCNLSFLFRNFRTIFFWEVRRVWGALYFVMCFLYVFWTKNWNIFLLSLWVLQMTCKAIDQLHFSELVNTETPFTQIDQEESLHRRKCIWYLVWAASDLSALFFDVIFKTVGLQGSRKGASGKGRMTNVCLKLEGNIIKDPYVHVWKRNEIHCSLNMQ